MKAGGAATLDKAAVRGVVKELLVKADAVATARAAMVNFILIQAKEGYYEPTHV